MDNIQAIKDRLDLADFVRGYLQLTPAGRNLKGLCPFHKEKTPSFMVSPDRQIWHCFGCGAGGDLIGFLMKYENLEFFEALKILGEKAGIDIGRSGTQDQKKINVLYEINRVAKDFFKETLRQAQGKQEAQGKQVSEYLKSRGLKQETIEEFEIGFAPDSSDALTRFLLAARYSVSDIERAGLSIKTERGTYRDRFRNRVMFPLFNQFGKVIAFTGRIMPGYESENIGKYVNSPETPIFNKSKLLYGLDKSKGAIRDSKTAILMEGQMDFIMSWQDGVKNLVATSGTALTADHLKSLKKIADNLILSFDQDEAGRMATERTIDLAAAEDFSVKVINWSGGAKPGSESSTVGLSPATKNGRTSTSWKDPADIALATPGMLKTFVEQAQPAMEYYLDKYLRQSRESSMPTSSSIRDKIGTKSGQVSSVGELKKNIRLVLSKIKNIASAIERDHWIKKIANLTGIGESVMLEEMENLKQEAGNKRQETEISEIEQSQNQAPVSRREVISQRIASLVLNNKEFYSEITPHLAHLPDYYQTVIAYHFDNKSLSLSPELQSLADLINLRAGLEINLDAVKSKEELSELFRQVKLENCREKRQEILTSIRIAEQKNDDATLAGALIEFDKLSKEMQNLENVR